jgi:hypothetical protein
LLFSQLDLAPPPSRRGLRQLAIELIHAGVYSVATSAAYELLTERPNPATTGFNLEWHPAADREVADGATPGSQSVRVSISKTTTYTLAHSRASERATASLRAPDLVLDGRAD